jgi:hypothetical protein
MRLCVFALGLTIVTAAGCGDDDDAAPSDASLQDAGGGEVTRTDARVPADGHADGGRSKDAGEASDAGDAATCALEDSYLWAFLTCVDEPPQRIAKRVTKAEFCKHVACPRDWTAALAAVAACDDTDAGWNSCWSVSTRCGAHRIEATAGPDGRLLYYDSGTGALIGGAIQLQDTSYPIEACRESELIWGENAPVCCDDDADAG